MDKIQGFTIRHKGRKLYAVKRVLDKVFWVSLGDTTADAESKITSYCVAKGIDPNAKTARKPRVKHHLTVRDLENKLAILDMKQCALDSENKKLWARLEKLEKLDHGRPCTTPATTSTIIPNATMPKPARKTTTNTTTAKRVKPLLTLQDGIARAKELHEQEKTWHDIRSSLHLSRENRKDWQEPIRQALGLDAGRE